MPADRGPLPEGAGPRVRVLTRAGCHLCDDALDVARRVCAELGEAVQAVDVDGDTALRERWTDHVPVTFVDGIELSKWFLDEEALRTALRTR